ncbi:MAG: thioredoxin family protein [Campylobacteraceae bacterium]|jgi:thiol-disulfide isomerase/thioredoxin|nr:thioredoxin family protein [Campylobacteraceae bacterium]MBT3882158.1 thioredoxin family protein [Campylobacteraceae bacterium]MBT4179488.1 thioredoxin family protein [Campylobacteraceae bacterium]MBT4572017.1 thioredoxin family protein [Campylobacteraceae bacterium]MBT5323465.1 thioredoxin family protein [Campylobacteraceae bacterium]
MEVNLLKKIIKEKEAIIVYFSGENCSVCKVLQPKIKETIKNNFEKINFLEIKTEDYPLTCGEYSIFSIPTILVFLDGKEFARYGRNISIAQFIQNTSRPYNLLFG